MTERKPAGLNYESWVDKQIREATERGEFADLPGAGKPIPRDGSGDQEHWWLKNYLRKEGAGTEVMLPPGLLLRREVERFAISANELDSEQAVRKHAAALNRRIVDFMRAPTGPQVPVSPVDIDDALAQWRAAHPAKPRPASRPVPSTAVAGRSRGMRRWFRRADRSA